MQKTNSSETRHKKLLEFAWLLTGVFFVVFLIMLAFKKDDDVLLSDDGKSSLDSVAMPGDLILQKRLAALETLDAQFSSLLAANNQNDSLAYANARITDAELKLAATVDSILKQVRNMSSQQAAVYNPLINSFSTIVRDRKYMSDIRTLLANGDVTLKESQLEMLEGKSALLEKDKIIADLESKLFDARQQGSGPSVSKDDRSEEFKEYQEQIEEQKASIARLNTQNATLVKSNNLLETKIATLNTNVPAPASKNTSESNSGASTEERMEVLNADLSFAAVDCNLARVDARQIISNARQRKEFLEESARILNAYTRSGIPSVQKKARDRMVLLNKIASTLRD